MKKYDELVTGLEKRKESQKNCLSKNLQRKTWHWLIQHFTFKPRLLGLIKWANGRLLFYLMTRTIKSCNECNKLILWFENSSKDYLGESILKTYWPCSFELQPLNLLVQPLFNAIFSDNCSVELKLFILLSFNSCSLENGVFVNLQKFK